MLTRVLTRRHLGWGLVRDARIRFVLDAECLPLEHKQLLKNAQLELKKSKRKDYYKILGVDMKASADEVRKAHRKQTLLYHLDGHRASAKFGRKLDPL